MRHAHRGAPLSTQATERLVATLILITLLIVACALSKRIKAARKLLDGIALTLAFGSIIATSAILVPLMFIFYPLYRCYPSIWYLIGNSLWCPMWALCILTTEVFGGMRVVLYGELPPAGEPLLITPNHLSSLDWIVVLCVAARCDALSGLRFIMKASLAKMPLLGWGLKLHHSVFIRSRPEGREPGKSKAARAASVKRDMGELVSTVKSLTSNPVACESRNSTCWIVLYAEGTRLIPEQHTRSLAFAQESGKQPFKYLLQPRSKGLGAVLDGGKPHLKHALDLTVAYRGFSAECEKNTRPAGLSDGIVSGDQEVHVLLRRVPLPLKADDDHQAWLDGVWMEKERALARWEHDGSFEAERLEELPLAARPLIGGLVAYAACAAAAASASVLGAVKLYHVFG